MAWTTPKTFVAGAVLTAAELNTHLRDNLNETCPATVTTAGDLVYADAANSMGSRLAIGASGTMLVSTGAAPAWRVPTWDNGDAVQTSTTSPPTSYSGLDVAGWGTGEAVAVSATTDATAIVLYGARSVKADDTTTSVDFSIDVSGATTAAAADSRSSTYTQQNSGDENFVSGFTFFTSLTGGSNTFTLQAKATYSGTPTIVIRYPRILVIPL